MCELEKRLYLSLRLLQYHAFFIVVVYSQSFYHLFCYFFLHYFETRNLFTHKMFARVV